MRSTNYLIDENPLTIQPTLIMMVGFERAAILQQIHFLANGPKSGVVIDGEKWVYNTYKQWVADFFPFWAERTIRAHFTRLEKDGLLISCRPRQKNWDTTKYYRINHEKLDTLLTEAARQSGDQEPDRRGFRETPRRGHYLPPLNMDSDTHTNTHTDTPPTEEEATHTTAQPMPTAVKQPKPVDARSKHPAIKMVRSILNAFPPKDLWDTIITTLGNEPDEVFYRSCYTTWRSVNGNPRNLEKWLFEPSRTGKPPVIFGATNGGQNGNGRNISRYEKPSGGEIIANRPYRD